MAVTSKVHKFKAQIPRLISVPLHPYLLIRTLSLSFNRAGSQPVDQLLNSETVAIWVGLYGRSDRVPCAPIFIKQLTVLIL